MKLKGKFKQLEFVTNFCQMNLASLRPSELMKVKEDISAFMGWRHELNRSESVASTKNIQRKIPLFFPGAEIVIFCSDLPISEDFPIKKLENIQKQLRAHLRMFAGTNTAELTDPGTTFCVAGFRLNTNLSLIPTYLERKESSHSTLTADIDLEQAFQLILMELLRELAYSLRSCLDCSRIFVATDKRKLFCSKKCANRRMAQNWRDRHKEKLSAKNRKNYERYVEKTLGPKVKAGRYKPRKKRSL